MTSRAKFEETKGNIGDVTKVWNFDNEGTKYAVVLRHNIAAGSRKISLNGDVVSRADRKVVEPEQKFDLGEQKDFIVITTTKVGTLKYTYTCAVGGSDVAEAHSSMTGDMDDAAYDYKSEVKTVEIIQEGSGSVGVYLVFTIVQGEVAVVQRRYSEFETLLSRVKSAYSSSHLKSSIPELPSKYSGMQSAGSIWSSMSGKKNLDPTFLEERRAALQDFLRRLLGVPKMRQSPDMLPFLGVTIDLKPTTEAAMLAAKLGVDRARTTSGGALSDTFKIQGQELADDVRVIFKQVGYLGLKLTPVDAYCEENGVDRDTIPGNVVVSGFQPCGVAPENMLAARENIAPGFSVSSVQGTAALNCTVEQVIEKSTAGGRPLTIGFVKPIKK